MQYYYMKIFFLMGKRSSPTVPDTNRRWWVHITNGWRTHHRRFMNQRWWTPSITAGSGTGGDGPAITIDLNPTIPKTVGDAILEPTVIGVAVVVLRSLGFSSTTKPTSPTAATTQLPFHIPGAASRFRSASSPPAGPPRVSYLCVFSRCPADARKGDEEEEMITIEPQVIATDGNLVLVRIIVCPEESLFDGVDLYIYRPAGDGGPLLRRLERPPGDYFFNSYQVGILSCPTDRLDGSSNLSFLRRPHRAPEDEQYMVVALSDDESRLVVGGGRFVLYLYNSKLRTWTTSAVAVEDQHFNKYQQEGYFVHDNCKVISVGGEHGTIRLCWPLARHSPLWCV